MCCLNHLIDGAIADAVKAFGKIDGSVKDISARWHERRIFIAAMLWNKVMHGIRHTNILLSVVWRGLK